MAANKSTEFPFSDLPLLIDRGFHAGLASGYAELSYFATGEFCIEALYLDGWLDKSDDELQAELDVQKLSGGMIPSRRKWRAVAIKRGSPIYQMIMDRLETDWRDSVQDHVHSAIQRDYESAADAEADHRIARLRVV